LTLSYQQDEEEQQQQQQEEQELVENPANYEKDGNEFGPNDSGMDTMWIQDQVDQDHVDQEATVEDRDHNNSQQIMSPRNPETKTPNAGKLSVCNLLLIFARELVEL
jgi:hypothetical protein